MDKDRQQSLFGSDDAEPTDSYFLATFPPPEAVARIQALQALLRNAHSLTGNPLAADRLHITLCHLGDYVGENRDVAAKAARAAASVTATSFEIAFDRVGSFASRARNKPFVLRSSEGVAAVEAFQSQLHYGLKSVGLGKWAKKSTPHVTLLYDNQNVPEQANDPITWRTEEFVLVHSELGKTRHHILERWPLRA